jgi:DNA-binding response OmpR family regulator
MKLLFVENHSVFANLTSKKLLSDSNVQIALSLTEARKMLKENSFDIILIDYDLDDGKGTELFDNIEFKDGFPIVIGVSAHQASNIALSKRLL